MSIVYFQAPFILEASFLCLQGATAGHSGFAACGLAAFSLALQTPSPVCVPKGSMHLGLVVPPECVRECVCVSKQSTEY